MRPENRLMDGGRGTAGPSLLAVVPWSVGYAHSWALRALLAEPYVAPLVLRAMRGLPGKPPFEVTELRREKPVGRRRADVAVRVRDAVGEERWLAVETKVNDEFKPDQVKVYRDKNHVPVLFLPGTTGVLIAPTETVADEVRFFGSDLLDALDLSDASFGPILAGYLDGLRSETARLKRAMDIARGRPSDPVGPGEVDEAVLLNAAWLAEVYRGLLPRAEAAGIDARAVVRWQRNDVGIYFSGGRYSLPAGGETWVDVLSDVRTHRRSVALKVGGNADPADVEARRERSPGDGWKKTVWSPKYKTCCIWKLDLDSGSTSADGASAAVEATLFARSFG